jgi:hypothetical protein
MESFDLQASSPRFHRSDESTPSFCREEEAGNSAIFAETKKHLSIAAASIAEISTVES